MALPSGIDGYHWFRHRRDGSTFIAYAEDGEWYMIAIPRSISSRELQDGAAYLHPVEAPQPSRLN